MRLKIRKHFEVLLIRFAIYVLVGRNVHRCLVVSRRDNNDMYYDGEKLELVCKRMLDEYQHV